MPTDATAIPGIDTIQAKGCFMTCIGMLGGLDPEAMDVLLSRYNGFTVNTNNTPDLKVDTAALVAGLQYAGPVPYSQDEILKQFNQGNDVVINMTHTYTRKSDGKTITGPHYVVVTGVGINPITHQCDFTVDDPGGRLQYLSSFARLDNAVFKNIRVFIP